MMTDETNDRLKIARDAMIALLRERDITSPAVLSAMASVPREAFVPADLAARAYEDGPLPIGQGQTISQPYIVALMIQSARVESGSRVLEIGAGSGYSVAVLCAMEASVHAIERHAGLADEARARLASLGLAATIETGDGTLGAFHAAPFDAIIVTAGGPSVPDALTRQLAIGGCMVIPVGADMRSQSLIRITRKSEEDFEEDDLGAVAFVPLIGRHGWTS